MQAFLFAKLSAKQAFQDLQLQIYTIISLDDRILVYIRQPNVAGLSN